MPVSEAQFYGLLLDTAVADSLGLPLEGLKPSRIQRWHKKKALQQSPVVLPGLRIGLCSDDTEHAWLTAQALLVQGSEENEERFSKQLAKRPKWWFLSLPAGPGMATLKACLQLCFGVSPKLSGSHSAGNGALVRAPVLGVFFANNHEALARYIHISTKITHCDERAIEGAWVMAMSASIAFKQRDVEQLAPMFFTQVLPYIKGAELKQRLKLVQASLKVGYSFSEYLQKAGMADAGISGYVNNTVPAVIFAWLKYPADYEQAVSQIILAGGDTDTTAALVGALIGANQGVECIPAQWLSEMKEWPADKTFGAVLD